MRWVRAVSRKSRSLPTYSSSKALTSAEAYRVSITLSCKGSSAMHPPLLIYERCGHVDAVVIALQFRGRS